MGVAASTLHLPTKQRGTNEEDALSHSIDQRMRKEREEEQSQIKLLLLGSENSGKSTVMKQFQIIHKMGFSAEERKVFRDQLSKSAIESMRTLVMMRQDYISTHNLDECSDQIASLEPYVQILQNRVRLDQELFEEVNIPVAARAMASPRVSNDFFPILSEINNNNANAGESLSTLGTVVLSQPPVAEAAMQQQQQQQRFGALEEIKEEDAPNVRYRRRKREFASVEEELLHRRAKYESRPHTKRREFASDEEELAFYRDRVARKKKRALEAKLQQQQEEARTSSPCCATPVTMATKASFTDSCDSNNTAINAGGRTMAGGGASASAAAAAGGGKIHQVKWEKLSIGRLLQKIWVDPIIQICFQLEEQNPILDAPLGYIMKEMDRMCEPGFQPTNDDVLHCRKRTAGATFLKFDAYDTRFLLIDVGGQKGERKRWILNFDNADVVIFVVGMDQYDQVDAQDGENKLKDAIDLFSQMCKSPWLSTSSFLLFLNKSDIFKTKIKQIPFNVSPYIKREYRGDPHDHEQCTKFIIKKFQQIHNEWYQVEKERRKSISSSVLAQNASNNLANGTSAGAASRRKSSSAMMTNTASHEEQIPQMYWYVTCATDTESMKFIIHMCRDIYLKKEMAKFGFTDV